MRSSAGREETSSHMVVPYEQTSQLLIHSKQSRREGNSSGATRSRKLASAIVSPHGVAHPMAMEENVTVRNKFEVESYRSPLRKATTLVSRMTR